MEIALANVFQLEFEQYVCVCFCLLISCARSHCRWPAPQDIHVFPSCTSAWRSRDDGSFQGCNLVSRWRDRCPFEILETWHAKILEMIHSHIACPGATVLDELRLCRPQFWENAGPWNAQLADQPCDAWSGSLGLQVGSQTASLAGTKIWPSVWPSCTTEVGSWFTMGFCPGSTRAVVLLMGKCYQNTGILKMHQAWISINEDLMRT